MNTGVPNTSLRVGVTGGIGSGKSTVCTLFERLGRTVISADAIARDLTERDEEVRKRIRESFGKDTYRDDGSLDRKRLADIVFKDPASRKTLDGIVHPSVFASIETRIGALSVQQRTPYILIEAALVYESGMEKGLDYTIVVSAPEDVRIARVMARDRCTREEVLLRIQSQMSVEEKRRRADFIIENDGSEVELQGRVVFVDTLLRHVAVKSS